MDNVYDYMFHLLTAYSTLMKYKPTVPEGEDGDGDGATSAMVAKQRRQWWRCDVGDGGVAKTSMVKMQRNG
ncbi:lipopolysaccharide-modifying protein [Artemisia annua]|uniref:Lipopolysaccharide-modifying protein n=1 Tax=Artemisia annua TaxID=35608 RepID=A0A2U1KY63_ARTAN|nr:lipopolysaccharide-modifying protein [Artemisia annua]